MSVRDLTEKLSNAIKIDNEEITIIDEANLRDNKIDKIIWEAVFSPDSEVKSFCLWILRKLAQKLNLGPASIYDFYLARGRGEFSGLTVPAVNIRGLTYDVARSVFRAAKSNNSAAIIFEIARSEIGYTGQRPSEYSASVIAAAIKENYSNPLFIQGDHFQVGLSNYKKDSESELSSIKSLISEALDAGFYNIDLDTSTLVDLSYATIKDQQKTNFETAAELTRFIQQNQPNGINTSLGGEIGEIGGKNSTVEEIRAYLDGYVEALGSQGLTKVAIQTGTTHGGVPLPGGGVADIKLDFDTLESLGRVAQKEYGLAGVVQHGASTLPSELFDKFPKTETAEVHLATEFQNMIYDHRLFPNELRNEINNWINKECASERKDTDTQQQFIYKIRKKAFGPFKKDMWTLPEEIRDEIAHELENKFSFLFQKLNIADTAELIRNNIKVISTPILKPKMHIKDEVFEGSD